MKNELNTKDLNKVTGGDGQKPTAYHLIMRVSYEKKTGGFVTEEYEYREPSEEDALKKWGNKLEEIKKIAVGDPTYYMKVGHYC